MSVLRELRRERKLSLRQLGELVNIDYSEISKMERGERGLNDQTLIAFADFFQVSTDYILGRTDKRPEAIKPKEIFKSPYKETQTFKNIVKTIDRLTLDELQMVNGVITAIVGDTTKDKKAE